MTNSCQVRVGVRIRPLTSKEVSHGGKCVIEAVPPQVGIGKRKFTYDSVFDSHVSQQDLYNRVAPSLLSSFLEGYNATIMAYGQTGSGKTYTMGSEAHAVNEDVIHPGLIPRFMASVFQQLAQRKSEADSGKETKGPLLLDFQVKASFLEVYGEDVHDLLDEDRKTLPLREDASGGVVVAGLTNQPVSSSSEALNILHVGTRNRTTAATLMNLTSSRSHAVFTIYLTQTTRNSSGDTDVDMTITSKFTFVDLAGSERMKKTGAEGERAREGIKINEGLLALGNVINALADDQRVSKEKKIHVPYRQSKLTRLLQDALGGNSQTFFIACVSPADSNTSETLSTLHYANRARNIKNAPTKNVDGSLLELQHLRSLNHILQCELVKHYFGQNSQAYASIGAVDENLWKQTRVQQYLQLLQKTAEEKQNTFTKPMLSMALQPSMAPAAALPPPLSSSASQDVVVRTDIGADERVDESFIEDVNPDEDMAILDQLLDLQQKDSDFQKERKSDQMLQNKVQAELEEKEGLLLQLRDSLKVYHNLKEKYEILVTEIQQLEVEKTSLAAQLEKAKVDPTKGCSLAIKKKLEKVEANLARARNETRKHQKKYREAEQEAQKCKALERKITDLKHSKSALIKKQRQSEARHRAFEEGKRKEIIALKRKEKSTGRKMTKLLSEVQMHKTNLEKRKALCDKLAAQKKQTEAHLMKLLSMRKRELHERTSAVNGVRQKTMQDEGQSLPSDSFATSTNEVSSMTFVLDRMINDHVQKTQLQSQYEQRVSDYGDIMRSMVEEVKSLEQLRKQRNSGLEKTSKEKKLEEQEQIIEDLDVRLEVANSDVESLREKIESVGSNDIEQEAKTTLGKVSAPVARSVLWQFVDKQKDSLIDKENHLMAIKRKDAAIHSLESEVGAMNDMIQSLSEDLGFRKKLAEDGSDPAAKVKELNSTVVSLRSELDEKQDQLDVKATELKAAEQKASSVSLQLAEAREKLTVSEAISKQGDVVHVAESTLDVLQTIWKRVGVPSGEREVVRLAIMSALEDTCQAKLEEAREFKSKVEAEIQRLQQEIHSMSCALGRQIEPDAGFGGKSLLERLESLKTSANLVRPEFDAAQERKTKLVAGVESVLASTGASPSSLSTNLSKLFATKNSDTEHDVVNGSSKRGSSKDKRAAIMREVTGLINALDGANDASPQVEKEGMLESQFLDSCEKELRALRLHKTESLTANSKFAEEAHLLFKEMHLKPDAIFTIMTETGVELPSSWETEVANDVIRAITSAGQTVQATESFGFHLSFILDRMKSWADERRKLSSALKEVVNRTQRSLLTTVDEEADASEAYASFHSALFKLPPLSEEHVEACIEELYALVSGVDAMIQSEIEALTVVWEALSVSTVRRGKFWADLKEATKALQSKENPFVNPQSKVAEKWLSRAFKDAREVVGVLEARLLKLERVHDEVESLRSKQDTKSRIMSLDSEIRILSANLEQFEDKQCDKQRLLTKKTGSSNLLREERFRKQMQTKFTSKLSQLTNALKTWKQFEGHEFEGDIVSKEVRMLLDNPGRMDKMVANRTEFMHLRTVQRKKLKRSALNLSPEDQSPCKRQRSGEKAAKTTRQRSDGSGTSASSNGRSRTRLAPTSAKKRNTPSHGKSPMKKTKSKRLRPAGDQLRSPLSTVQPKGQQPTKKKVSSVSKPRTRSQTKRETLLPFEHLLSENKEN